MIKSIKNINLKSKKINDKTRNQIRSDGKGILGFRIKLIMGFLVPVVLIIIVGIVSYNRSKSTIIKNYEEATLGNMENSSLYFNLMMKDIESKSSQIANNNDLIYYHTYYGKYSDVELNTYYTNLKNSIDNINQNTDGIYNIYVFGKEGVPFSTLRKEPKTDTYQTFQASENMAKWEEVATTTGGRKAAWIGYHDSIDEGLGASQEFYAASYVRTFAKGEGNIIIDLNITEVELALQNSISNDNAIAVFITTDGRETVVSGKGISQKGNELPNVSKQNFYLSARTGEPNSGYEYISYKGEDSLFVYSKIGNTGAMVYSIIPKADIFGNLSMIKTAIAIIVVIACIIAILIGLYFTNDISKIIDKFSKSFQQIANGNLKLRMNTTRQDEFGDLARDMDRMLENIQGLVSDMASFSSKVTDAALNVSGASSEILDAVNGIYDITKLMDQGINDQRQDIENSYSQMSNFAEQINEAYDDTRVVDELADNTQTTVGNGKDIVNELMKQVTSTADLTGEIIADIKQLQEQSKNIGTVVETINEIASTTELLSLNASIEAVRSGDAGRGFAVIASEIRKLAEQSMNSVKSIEHMIVSIQNMTKKTSTLADRANEMLKTQADSLNNTVDLFGDVDSHMINLMDKMNHIMENMQAIMVSKDGILDLIRNIAAVSEETVASSEDVASTVARQVTSVETLESQSNNLKDQAVELVYAIDKFII